MLARYVRTGRPLPSSRALQQPPPPISPRSRENKINRIHIEHDDKIYWKLMSCKSSTHAHAVVPSNVYSAANHLYTSVVIPFYMYRNVNHLHGLWPYHLMPTVVQIIYTCTVLYHSMCTVVKIMYVHCGGTIQLVQSCKIYLYKHYVVPSNVYSHTNHLYTHCGGTI